MDDQAPSILIVDDNPDNLKIIGSFLRKEGYAIRLAQSGPSAIESAAKPVSFPFPPFIQDVFEQLSHGAEQKSIRLIEPPTVEAFVFADMEMTQTIVRNFVSNAIKFTPPGGTIRVELRQEGEFQEIDVIDTGTGIPPEKQKTLFTNNVQSSRGTDGEKGSGLGLLICKELAERQGGSVGVESEPGKGSRFILRLPRAVQS